MASQTILQVALVLFIFTAIFSPSEAASIQPKVADMNGISIVGNFTTTTDTLNISRETLARDSVVGFKDFVSKDIADKAIGTKDSGTNNYGITASLKAGFSADDFNNMDSHASTFLATTTGIILVFVLLPIIICCLCVGCIAYCINSARFKNEF